MPSGVYKRGDEWRVLKMKRRNVTRAKKANGQLGKARDGGGHKTRAAALRQVLIINAPFFAGPSGKKKPPTATELAAEITRLDAVIARGGPRATQAAARRQVLIITAAAVAATTRKKKRRKDKS